MTDYPPIPAGFGLPFVDQGTWLFNSDIMAALNARYLNETIVNAKGDLLVGTADNTISRLAVGSSGDRLVVDSSHTGGVWWDPNHYFTYRKTASYNFLAAGADVVWDASPQHGTLAGFTTSDRSTFTCSTAGVWSIGVMLTAQTASPSVVALDLYKNGTRFRVDNKVTSTTGYTTLQLNVHNRLDVGDTIQVVIRSGTTIAGVALVDTTAFELYKVGV